MAELIAGTPGPGRSGCHTVPAHLAGGLLFCAPALGAAHRALDVWSRWAAGADFAGQPAGGSRQLHHVLARSANDIEAARLLLQDAARRADAHHRTARDVATNQRLSAAAADLLVEGTERLFRTGGVHVRGGSPVLERCWRDVHTIAAHQALQSDSALVGYATSVFAELLEDRSAPVAAMARESVTALEASVGRA
jgi:two-component flavin-dependent monooxygenase